MVQTLKRNLSAAIVFFCFTSQSAFSNSTDSDLFGESSSNDTLTEASRSDRRARRVYNSTRKSRLKPRTRTPNSGELNRPDSKDEQENSSTVDDSLFGTTSNSSKKPRPYPKRLPDLYNPNPIARLYIQMLGPHEDQVVDSFRIELSETLTSEFNRYFHDDPNNKDGQDRVDLLYMNSNIRRIRMAYGTDFKGLRMEFAGEYREPQDLKNNQMEDFLRWFHEAVATDSQGHIPPDGQPYYGRIGNGNTRIIGEDLEVFMRTLELFTKVQILEEKDDGGIPNLTIKLGLKVPVTSKEFDRWGAGLSVGFSKKLIWGFGVVAAGALAYQDISAKHFKSSNLDVKKWVHDLFLGLQWDPGEEGGFYANFGYRQTSRRIVYTQNPNSAQPSHVIFFSLHYAPEHGRYEYFISVAEEIPTLTTALEPDFALTLGMSFFFGRPYLSKDKDLFSYWPFFED